jgi:hypothetical protein
MKKLKRDDDLNGENVGILKRYLSRKSTDEETQKR